MNRCPCRCHQARCTVCACAPLALLDRIPDDLSEIDSTSRRAMDGDPTCRCGHPRDQHEHHSAWRSDCGRCGRELCPAFRRPPSHLSQAAAQRINRVLAIIRRRR